MRVLSLLLFSLCLLPYMVLATTRYSIIVSTPGCAPGYDCIGSQIIKSSQELAANGLNRTTITSAGRIKIDCNGFGGFTCNNEGYIALCNSGKYCPDHLQKYTCPEGKVSGT